MGSSNVENILESMIDGEIYDQEPSSRVEGLLKNLNGSIQNMSDALELFDPLATYKFTKANGTVDSTITPRADASDYYYNMSKDINTHGRRYYELQNQTMEPGTYILTAHVTLATSDYKRVCVGIGRDSVYDKECWLMTEKGGDQRISGDEKSGWIKYTRTITESTPWAFMVECVNSKSATGQMRNVSLVKMTSKDESARDILKQLLTAISNKTTATIDGFSVDFGNLAGDSEITVTETDASITAEAGKRYACSSSALTSLAFTPSQTGLCEVIFTSGATPTVLTIPNTVKMPSWWTGVQANTVYDIMVLNGVYGAVSTWTS